MTKTPPCLPDRLPLAGIFSRTSDGATTLSHACGPTLFPEDSVFVFSFGGFSMILFGPPPHVPRSPPVLRVGILFLAP